MKRVVFLTVLALAAVGMLARPPAPGATEFSLESRTFLPVREDGNSNTHALVYEYLAFEAEEVALPGLFFRAGGWGRADLADETYGKKTNGEIQYGFAGWRAPVLNAELRLGRVSPTGGAARNENLDGLQFSTDLPAGFDLLAYGGVPVETDEAGHSKDSIFGGRVSQGLGGIYRLGLSYLKEKDDDADAREEAALDLSVTPPAPLTLSGTSLYNVDTDKWARHDWRLALGPFFSLLRVTGRYGWTDYSEFFTASDNPAFGAAAADLEEKLQSLGGELELSLPGGWRVAGDYTHYDYDVADAADAYGGRVDFAAGALSAGLSYHRCHGETDELRYADYRLFGTYGLGHAKLALGLQEVRYDEEINGTKDATTVSLAGDWELSPSLAVGADVEYGRGPDFTSEVKGMAQLTWRWAAGTKGGAAK